MVSQRKEKKIKTLGKVTRNHSSVPPKNNNSNVKFE